MSQKKLSQKQQEDLLKKKKQQKITAILLIVLVIAACAGGIGWMVYDRAQQEQASKEAEAKKQEEIERSRKNTDGSTVNVDPILEYLSGLDVELLNEEIAPDGSTATGEAVSSEGAAVP